MAPFTPAVELHLHPDELWWGGSVIDGVHMPFGRQPFERDLGAPGGEAAPSNQSSPLLISTRGRVVWSERPFAYQFSGDRLLLRGHSVTTTDAGQSLRDAYLWASQHLFPPSGRAPATQLFSGPQYNTWIEQPYTPTQEGVLRYARTVLDDGMDPGVIIVDDSWAQDYGTWQFDRARFPDPAAMVAQLHDWGFAVMLWIVPFISPDSAVFRDLEARGLLIRDSSGETAIRRWWNGFSALLDLSAPAAVDWLTGGLDRLIAETGVNGFKFDAGDLRDYRADDLSQMPGEPVDFCEAWARIGLRYPFNEFRACWRTAGQPLGQRLQDKPPRWGPSGIGSLIPEMLAQSMLGHAFVCPDMIGGGEIGAVQGHEGADQEFFVRYAQVAALSPMTQFSIIPSRVLDAEHQSAVRSALAIRAGLLPEILELVQSASITGEPVLRPMAYHSIGLESVIDQFFLGPNLVVAPVLTPGAVERTVHLPAGSWKSAEGKVFTGPGQFTVPCDLTTIPRFRRQ